MGLFALVHFYIDCGECEGVELREDQDVDENVGYTGTPSASRARPKKNNSSKTPKRVKKDPVIATISTSMVSHPQSIGEASQAQTPSRYDHNVDPFKYVFKKTLKSDKERRAKTLGPRAADEPSTESRTASKRLDFDDPPQV
ncbi:hypothetical protein SUGI_0875730 [Cryptomeria japonica]|nr:hypothetical protein SUGI_0875730 [Cryptomeria japonica]